MKLNDNHKRLQILLGLLFMIYYLPGCFKDRIPTDPDFKAQDVRRPAITHHVPLSGATEVNRNIPITVWFDELMDETSVQDNFLVWPAVQIDSIQVIAVDPNNPEIIYAAKPGKGIFKSEDGAESWQWVTPSTMRVLMSDLVVSTDNSGLLYAASTDSGIYKSLDGGSVWQPVNSGLPELHILAIAVDPTNSDHIYAATGSNGIYKSEDGGISWHAKNNGVRPTRGPRDIVINPSNSNTLYAATQGDFILKSEDGGESWTRLRTGLFTFNFKILAIHPQDTNLVFAVSDGGGIYRSKNGGTNWELIVAGLVSLDIQAIAVHPQNTNIVIISTASGLYKSLDGGDNWNSAGNIPDVAGVAMLSIDPVTPERIFAATASGIYRSETLGDSWTEKNTLPLDYLYVAGAFDFEAWQDSTVVIAPLNSTTMDTTIISPYIYKRALAAWIASGKKGEPPVEVNSTATKMVFNPNSLLPPNTDIQVRIQGTFESDRETLRSSLGAQDIHGNSLEIDYNFLFTTGQN